MSAGFHKVNGVAGQVMFIGADGTHYIGSAYGSPGPVFIMTPSMSKQVLVRNPERFGERFNADWCRRFEEESA